MITYERQFHPTISLFNIPNFGNGFLIISLFSRYMNSRSLWIDSTLILRALVERAGRQGVESFEEPMIEL